VWLAVMSAFGAAAALLVTVAARRPLRTAWPWIATAGFIGAVMGASLADRFGWPQPLVFRVWRREVPLVWAAGGALLGAVAAWGLSYRRQRQQAAAAAGLLPDD
jgi:hypothetical protein